MRAQAGPPGVAVKSCRRLPSSSRGSVQDAAGKKDVIWLESAVLLKEAGGWRIQFFHSTRVPSK